jgi:hypothetical protein
MSDPQATFTIGIPYKDQDGCERFKQYSLTLTLSLSSLIEVTEFEGEQWLGEIKVQGPVMPVEDPRDGSPAPVTAEEDEMDQAIAA